MTLFCLLDFSVLLSYAPRHVSFRNLIRQHRLGISAAPILEQPDRDSGPTDTRC